MDEEDGGDAKGELAVLGFVAEEVHAHEGADAAAGNGQPDEGVFGDAPLPSPGLPFVDAVDQEGQDIDADEVDDEGAHITSQSPFRLLHPGNAPLTRQ